MRIRSIEPGCLVGLSNVFSDETTRGGLEGWGIFHGDVFPGGAFAGAGSRVFGDGLRREPDTTRSLSLLRISSNEGFLAGLVGFSAGAVGFHAGLIGFSAGFVGFEDCGCVPICGGRLVCGGRVTGGVLRRSEADRAVSINRWRTSEGVGRLVEGFGLGALVDTRL